MILSSPPPPLPLDEAYRAAHEASVVVDQGARGLLLLTGQSRLDLLHRMSTQAVSGLKPGQGAATVLTTEIGRIIDRVIVYAGDDYALLLAGEGHAEALARYLRRNIFFNDDVQVADLSGKMAILGVYGPRAADRLGQGWGDAAGLPLHHWRPPDGAPGSPATALERLHETLYRADPLHGDGYYVLAAADRVGSLLRRLAGDAPEAPFIDEAAYDYLRIEAGRPRFGRELTLDYIPLEAGLWDDVSFHKGCYTGQEIIARLESRGKLAKRLARLRPAAPLAAGAAIVAAGRPAGAITSAADGPAGPLALGYVKASALDEAAPLTAGEVPLSLA